MVNERNTNWKNVTITVITGIFLLIIGGVFTKYIFKDKPELTYQITEGDPIETEVGDYYSTNLLINNTGDVPLGEVRVYLRFRGQVVKVSSNVYGDKINDDSINIKREFRMPKSTYAEFKITSKGKLLDNYISSAEVVGQKLIINTQDDAKRIMAVSLFFLGFLCLIFLGNYLQTNKNLKAMNQTVNELRDKIKLTSPSQGPSNIPR